MLLNLPGDMGIKRSWAQNVGLVGCILVVRRNEIFFLVCTSICAQANAEGYERNKTENY